MKLLHFSDLHIGVETYGSLDPRTGLSTRLSDFLDTYDKVLDFAIQDRVDLVVFCGDAYKSRDPSQTHQRAFAQGISRLVNEGIPVFLVVGNHDLPTVRSRASALEIFPTLRIQGVTVGDRIQVYTINTVSGPIQIVALPWIRRNEFASAEPSRASSIEEINRAIEQNLSELINQATMDLDPEVPAILAGHCTIAGAITSSEQSMMLGRDHVLLQSSVSLPVFEYVALGHIHRRQVLGGDPPIVYSGSLERVDFGEEKDTKGFYLVELDETLARGQRLLEYNFHPLDVREFLTISVTVPDDESDPTQVILDAISRQNIEDKVLRVDVTLPRHQEGALNERVVREALHSASFIAPIQRHIIGQRRTRWEGEGLANNSPLEALTRYLDTREGLSQERKEVLLDLAKELLRDDISE